MIDLFDIGDSVSLCYAGRVHQGTIKRIVSNPYPLKYLVVIDNGYLRWFEGKDLKK